MFIGFYGASVLLTYIGLAFSVTGMVLAFLGHIPAAVMCLILSGVCDMFDGTVARACKRSETEKKFGIQIDSLVDTVSFGVFPIVLGICMGFTSKLNTVIYIIYGLAAVIRLAYFNTLDICNKSEKGYFIGAPITTISIIYPIVYLICFFNKFEHFPIISSIFFIIVGISFIYRIKIKKLDDKGKVILSVLGILLIIAVLAKIIFFK